MAQRKIQDSKYKGVSKVTNGRKEYWMTQYRTGNHRWEKHCDTERQAAIAFDKKMLEIGKEPVNILVPK